MYIIQLSLLEKDFKDFRSFEKVIKKVFGESTYVGTDSMIIHVDYPKELKAMLRPYPEQQVFEFNLEIGTV